MIKIIVVDDEQLIRESIATLLGLEEGITVVATAASGTQALKEAAKRKPNVVVSDYRMPGMSGIEMATLLMEKSQTPTVLVTSFALPGLVETAIAGGVRGLLPKSASIETLTRTIRAVAQGNTYLDPDLAFQTMVVGNNPLTFVEVRVLELARRGMTPREISDSRDTTISTTRNHIQTSVKKLNARNLLEAISIAEEHGWLTSGPSGSDKKPGGNSGGSPGGNPDGKKGGAA
jgi:two-component system response regulator DesR